MLIAPPKDLFFKGRPGDLRLGEWVAGMSHETTPSRYRIAILGFPDDTGVTSNRGRAGAAKGPDSIRRHLYRMALPMDQLWEERFSLIDCGNIEVASDIRTTHRNAQAAAANVSAQCDLLITLGGGHDFAAPATLGVIEGRGAKDIVLANIDPHLDVRELESGLPHSGTPFRVLLESGKIRKFLEFGTQPHRNQRTHLVYCKRRGVIVDTLPDIVSSRKPSHELFSTRIRMIQRGKSPFALTLDMDSCFETEGTSAAPVVGFSARELCHMADAAGRIPHLALVDIAEVSPTLDAAERSSRIAAEFLMSILRSRYNFLRPAKREKKHSKRHR